MTRNYLLPPCFRKIGLIVFIPAAIAGIIELYMSGFFSPVFGRSDPWLKVPSCWEAAYHGVGIFAWGGWNELLLVVNIVALLCIAFSRERIEDECIENIRMKSLVWAVVVNYGIVILGTLLLYDIFFITFLTLNIYTVLLLYMLLFRIAIRRLNKSAGHEE